MALPLDQSIQRFISNDARVNTFANGSAAETYTTSGGSIVPSLQKFLADKSAEIDAELNLSSPLPIGNVTPNSGAFTSLSASGNVTLGDASTDTLNVGNGGLIKDAAGNVGIGGTPSAWGGLGGPGALQGYSFGLYSDSGTDTVSLAQSSYQSATGVDRCRATGAAPSKYAMRAGQHVWSTAPSGTAGDVVTFTQVMALSAAGNLLVGATSGTCHTLTKTGSNVDGYLLAAIAPPGVNTGAFFYGSASSAGIGNAANAMLRIGMAGDSSRSINAAGTINASGADYAEYERNNGLTIAKGSIVGFKADGTLTLTYSEAVRFGIKSTNPCMVGGDTWGTEAQVGQRPEKPQFVAAEYTGSQSPGEPPVAPQAPGEDATQEQIAEFEQAFEAYSIALTDYSSALHTYTMDRAQHAANVEVAQHLFDTTTYPEYERALAAFEVALEAARVQVDRVAYSGKVPVNVAGASPGDYIIASSSGGEIVGTVVADPTFAQYKKAVGRVNKILDDGRAEVAVIIH